jgi:hypothetical protein
MLVRSSRAAILEQFANNLNNECNKEFEFGSELNFLRPNSIFNYNWQNFHLKIPNHLIMK